MPDKMPRKKTRKRTVPFVDLYAQHKPIEQLINDKFARLVRGSRFVLGPELEQFEREFADYCEADHCIGVDSGTGALELALRALDIGSGHEVITAANTFTSTVAAIAATGATPVLVDADPKAWTMDPEAAVAAITARTRAVLPVHLYGQPAALDPLLAAARGRELFIIEDACQAHGARHRGRRVGGIGHVGCFSFYPSKNLGALGDGGAVTTRSSRLAKRIAMLRNYGQKTKSHHEVFPMNKRLDNIQAAILSIKLGDLDRKNDLRRAAAALYDKHFDEWGIQRQFCPEHIERTPHLYVILHPRRDKLRQWLGERGIESGVHYPTPIHLQKPFSGLGYARGSMPVAERLSRRVVSLPLYPELEADDIEYVAETVAKFRG